MLVMKEKQSKGMQGKGFGAKQDLGVRVAIAEGVAAVCGDEGGNYKGDRKAASSKGAVALQIPRWGADAGGERLQKTSCGGAPVAKCSEICEDGYRVEGKIAISLVNIV